MNRRSFLASTTGLCLTASFGGASLDILLGSSAHGQALRKETFMSAAGVSLMSSYTFCGVEAGFFREQGLDLQLQTGSGTAASLTQVASGGAMFGQAAAITSCPAIADRGAELITVGQVSYPGFFEIASLPGRPLNTPKDFEGKTIGIMSKGGSTELLLDAMLRSQGVDPAKVNRVITGLSTAGIAFMERGQVDGFFVFYETKVALTLEGVKLVYVPTDDYVTLPGDAMLVSSEGLKKPGAEDVLVRYLRGARKAMEFIRDPANEDRVLDYFAKHNPVQGGDRARGRATMAIVRKNTTPPAGTPLIHCSEQDWTKGIKLMEEIGVIKKKGLPPGTFFTNTYVVQATGA